MPVERSCFMSKPGAKIEVGEWLQWERPSAPNWRKLLADNERCRITELRLWLRITIEGHAARSDEAVLEIELPAKDMEAHLAEHVFPLVSSLYERFGVSGLSVNRVKAEVDRLLSGRKR